MTHLKTARAFANLMDNQFSFLGIRFGIDTFIGIVPGFGDFVTTLLACYLVWIGWQMKIPKDRLAEMIKNVVVDAILGAIPFLGDIFDLFYKANVRNLKILEEYERPGVVEGEVISRRSST